MIRYVIKIVMMLLITTSVSAETARQMLESFLQQTTTMQSRFEQRLFDHANILLQESTGDFRLKRPGRFLWDYKTPYAQQIVSNGKKIWIYDSELEQVTVKDYNQLLAGVPVILFDQKSDLDVDFKVEDQGFKNKFYWIRLVPIKKEGDYKEIQVAMAGKKIQRMIFVDGFDQTTVISFKNIEINSPISDSLFNFEPPQGTDVVGDF
ncbi:MAG: outer membrane lipoprotein chaperone LolA [Gammaproteobacteria bacterium]|nr:outer membrane lipoprotein chaperone LolA [Gammaproteobacteria bacterium]MCW8909666.1 outer membrane lipoprotein chaperone LolA [Gammaproteobacteria bacterium]MCW9004214.1 outer membrane lipoprotein chaperone LolA [Gammaproteobacteria bacterium]MCW9055403.1 outer membrane lipoprotein chaperone LolA [Gammaproteobacteria bacterium]